MKERSAPELNHLRFLVSLLASFRFLLNCSGTVRKAERRINSDAIVEPEPLLPEPYTQSPLLTSESMKTLNSFTEKEEMKQDKLT